MTLAGRIAVVTGGSRGIGRAIARSLVSGGANVLITGRSASDVETAARGLRGTNSRAHDAVEGFRADVRRPDEAHSAVEAAVKEGAAPVIAG